MTNEKKASIQSDSESSRHSLLTVGEEQTLRDNLELRLALGKVMDSPIVNAPLVHASQVSLANRRESYDINRTRVQLIETTERSIALDNTCLDMKYRQEVSRSLDNFKGERDR